MFTYTVGIRQWRFLLPALLNTALSPSTNGKFDFDEIFAGLMAHYQSVTDQLMESNEISFKIVERGSELAHVASDIVELGYSTRYLKPDATNVKLHHLFDPDHQRLAVATYVLANGEEIVLATMSGYLNEPEVFLLYEGHWPHEGDHNPLCAELKRFAMHPVFDSRRLADELSELMYAYKRLITRGLFQCLLNVFAQEGVDYAYYTIAPRLDPYFRTTGLCGDQIDVWPAKNEYASMIRTMYPAYWQPDAESHFQPHCFLMPQLSLADPGKLFENIGVSFAVPA